MRRIGLFFEARNPVIVTLIPPGASTPISKRCRFLNYRNQLNLLEDLGALPARNGSRLPSSSRNLHPLLDRFTDRTNTSESRMPEARSTRHSRKSHDGTLHLRNRGIGPCYAASMKVAASFDTYTLGLKGPAATEKKPALIKRGDNWPISPSSEEKLDQVPYLQYVINFN